MKTEKDLLPKGMSYPLKPSFLDQALAEAGIAIDAYFKRQQSAPYFRAYFWPPNPNIPYERLHMTLGAVPSTEAQAVRQRMELEVVPEMILWIKGICSQAVNSPTRREKQEFSRSRGK